MSGREQAKAVAAHVGAVDELISSPLRRATETAESSASRTSPTSAGSSSPTASTRGRPTPTSRPRRGTTGGQRVVGAGRGRIVTALAERVRAACLDLAERAGDHDVAVVTHVSPMKAAVAWVLGAGIEIAWRSHLSHASVCRIDMREGPGAVHLQRGRPLTMPATRKALAGGWLRLWPMVEYGGFVGAGGSVATCGAGAAGDERSPTRWIKPLDRGGDPSRRIGRVATASCWRAGQQDATMRCGARPSLRRSGRERLPASQRHWGRRRTTRPARQCTRTSS